jgi:hypothetical protein
MQALSQSHVPAAIAEEVVRLRPSFSSIQRKALSSVVLTSGLQVSAGEIVWLILQRHLRLSSQSLGVIRFLPVNGLSSKMGAPMDLP